MSPDCSKNNKKKKRRPKQCPSHGEEVASRPAESLVSGKEDSTGRSPSDTAPTIPQLQE